MVDKSKIFKPSPIGIHVKQCIHETMTLNNDNTKVIYDKFLITPQNYPCGGCNSPEDVVFMRTYNINEVIRSCNYCNITQPISPRNPDGTIKAQHFKAETHEMTIEEIKDFIKRNEIKERFVPEPIINMIESKREVREINVDSLDLEEE
jgi:hypothetical protein